MNFTLIFVDKFTLLKVKCHFSCAAHLNSDENTRKKTHSAIIIKSNMRGQGLVCLVRPVLQTEEHRQMEHSQK